MVERGGKLAKSLICSNPIHKPINFKGLKYAPALEKDTVQFAKKETLQIAKKKVSQIDKKANKYLNDIRQRFSAEYTEYVSWGFYPNIICWTENQTYILINPHPSPLSKGEGVI